MSNFSGPYDRILGGNLGTVIVNADGSISLTPKATFGTTVTGSLTFATAASKIIPGATSISHRNNADNADNLIILDAGGATFRNTVNATTFVGALTGNASTATVLATARAINGTNFDGSAPITVTAAAGTLTGTTLNATVTGSSLTSTGKIATYNAIATAGWGHPTVYASTTTGTITNATTTIVNAFAVPAADSSYEISVTVNVTASATAAMTCTISYTDVANTARVATVDFNLLTGVGVQSITTAQGNIDYTSAVTAFRCKASSTITIATAGSVVGITYTAQAIIKQVA